ncbi:MAG: hypothetical protein ACYCYF_00900 [Anaerolineae bacterium]
MTEGNWRRAWSHVKSRLRSLLRPRQQPKIYVNYGVEKPYYQKLTCEHQARSSTGPVARHAGRRR